jgi:hypothetical protein
MRRSDLHRGSRIGAESSETGHASMAALALHCNEPISTHLTQRLWRNFLLPTGSTGEESNGSAFSSFSKWTPLTLNKSELR